MAPRKCQRNLPRGWKRRNTSPFSRKPLTERQRALSKQWVAEGAVYAPHWAYAPLMKPALPTGAKSQHPIDSFVQAKLAQKNIAPSDEAPAAKLLRRLSLDLTGLPPTPEEIAAFMEGGEPASAPSIASSPRRISANAWRCGGWMSRALPKCERRRANPKRIPMRARAFRMD